MSFIGGLIAKHWKTALVLILLSGAGLYGWWQHHEAVKYRDQTLSFKQAARDAASEAKSEQAKADAALKRQRQIVSKRSKSADKAVKEMRKIVAHRRSERATGLNSAVSHNPGVKSWMDTPVPASVLAAIRGG